MNKFKLSVLVSAFLISGSAIAASDGVLTSGSVGSTGSSDVIIVKDNAVQISDVDDMDFGNQSVLGDNVSMTDGVCVFSSTGNYSVTVSSAGTSFELAGTGATPDAVAYSVQWDGVAVTHGTAQTGLIANATSLTCDGGTNATFAVTVDSSSFNSVKPDTYTDTLTLLVQPE